MSACQVERRSSLEPTETSHHAGRFSRVASRATPPHGWAVVHAARTAGPSVAILIVAVAGCVDSQAVLRGATARAIDAAPPPEDAPRPAVDDACAESACDASADATNDDAALESSADSDTGKPCGGIVGFVCASDEWCDYASCGQSDALGKCRKRPIACAPPATCPNKMCGCDGVTYCDPCEGQALGVDEKTPGPC